MPTREKNPVAPWDEALNRIEACQKNGATELDLSALYLERVPGKIGNLTKLQHLDLNNNQLTGLPSEFSGLKSLTVLGLSHNRFPAVPSEVSHLKSLTILDLSHNELVTVPAEIGELTLLNLLDLSFNRLLTIPPEIGRLEFLSTLVMQKNKLKTLIQELIGLKQLKSLYLSDNRLEVFPEEITKLTFLEELALSRNSLSELPPSIGALANLQALHLSHNRLEKLPSEIGQLGSLKSLDIASNRLKTLPNFLGELPLLETLSILDNPLAAELIRIGGEKGTRLINYIRVRAEAEQGLTSGLKRFDEAKLLLVGPGNVGKTWLLTALQGRKPIVNQTTKGIEIARVPMSVAHPADVDRNLQMNSWDFGGQEHYQITHQIFFSAKAIYLLVWKPRTGIDPDLINRLERIELSAGNSAKVLIVSTHADGNVPAVIGKDALKERFGDLIWGFFETDSAEGAAGTGIATLKTEIARASAQLAGMDEFFPQTWHEAQQFIRQTRKVTMTFEEFANACATYGMDSAQAGDLAGIMEVQGHAVFFADAAADIQSGLAAAENLVVLNPEWLAKAVGFVIEDKKTIATSGVLQHSHLAQIWKKDPRRDCLGYRKSLHGFLLWLMWKFDIAYKQNEHTSLVPEMIQRNRPDDLLWTPAITAAEPEATLICRIPQDPPAGLVPALTAAVHPLRRVQRPEETYDHLDRNWREGFFLDTLLRGTAFVELQDRELRVAVRDKYPANLTKLIVDTLEGLRKQRWPRLELDVRVPCIGKKEGKPCKGTFRKTWLEQRESKSVPCEECNQDVDPIKLLQGFDAREEKVLELLKSLDLGQRALQSGQSDLIAATYQFFQQTLDTARPELMRAPCLFSILPEEGRSWQPLSNLTENKIRVTCWCEHPDGPHPGSMIGGGDPPDYVITSPKDWLVKAAPYISWAAVLLKAFVPLAGTVAQQVLGENMSIDLRENVAIMNDATKALPSGKLELGVRGEHDSGLRLRPEIVALRHIHDTLLNQVPESKRWGELRPVTTKSGEILWLCAEHAAIQQPPVQVL